MRIIQNPQAPAVLPPRASQPFPFLTGFEGTHIFGSGWDVLETTEHTTRYHEDLGKLKADGIHSFRACIPWHRIEAEPGRYDWRWTDGYLACARDLGLDPIADPLHHTSFPVWLRGGFADPAFRPSYLAFVKAFARRYPWVTRYTVINEPFVTTWFCGHCEIWHPNHKGRDAFVPMLLTVAQAICEVTAALTRLVPGVMFIHAESCERHSAMDRASVAQAETGNRLRFSVLDLILGRVSRDHPLRPYLLRHGASEAQLEWFLDHPARVDVLGLDYYSHSELVWTSQGRASEHPVAGFASLALEYAERYRGPIMLSETNLRGTLDDRIGWLRYMVEECVQLAGDLAARGLSFEGFCWYPYIDSTDWNSLVREARRDIDPQGLYSLDASFDRHASDLTAIYSALGRGAIGADDIAVRSFSDDALDGRGVRNYLPHMGRGSTGLPYASPD